MGRFLPVVTIPDFSDSANAMLSRMAETGQKRTFELAYSLSTNTNEN